MKAFSLSMSSLETCGELILPPLKDAPWEVTICRWETRRCRREPALGLQILTARTGKVKAAVVERGAPGLALFETWVTYGKGLYRKFCPACCTALVHASDAFICWHSSGK